MTQHGYRDGGSVDYPAILQRGTAVLVNQAGEPVAKCAGGNPLTSPETTGTGEPSGYVGRAWPGFSPTATTVIRPAAGPIGTFSVLDPTTGRVEPQRVGGGGPGPVLAAPRPGAAWAVDAIDANIRYEATLEAVMRNIGEKCSNVAGVCLDVEYQFEDAEGNFQKDSTKNYLAPCDYGKNTECRFLHKLTYDPPLTKAGPDGTRLPCDPEKLIDGGLCKAQPGTRLVVQISKPLTEELVDEERKKAAREVDDKNSEPSVDSLPAARELRSESSSANDDAVQSRRGEAQRNVVTGDGEAAELSSDGDSSSDVNGDAPTGPPSDSAQSEEPPPPSSQPPRTTEPETSSVTPPTDPIESVPPSEGQGTGEGDGG